MYVGQRVPFLPPLGALFVAWAGEEEIQTWLDRLAPLPSAGVKLLQGELAGVRERGYSLGRAAHWHLLFNHAVRSLADQPASAPRHKELSDIIQELGREDYQISQLDPGQHYVLRSIAVPVFDSNAAVVANISTTSGKELLPEEILRIVSTLRDSATVVSKQANGRFPDSGPE